MDISVVVVSFNMTRELPRTILSLSPRMQRGIAAQDYEIIIVDNGSTLPIPEEACRRYAPDLVLHRMEHPTASPVRAINKGLELARGEIVGVFIDGARMASPGLLAAARAGARLSKRPVVGTLAFHLGPEVQNESVKKGYNPQVEDDLLLACGWEEDGYRLFDISTLAGSSAAGWFVLPAETNALFLRSDHWREFGGYDPAFDTPGGGLVNLDTWARLCNDPHSDILMLLGEATFHQVHGGIATNSINPPFDLFEAEYLKIRGHRFHRPDRQPLYFGSLPSAVLPSIEASLAFLNSEFQADLVKR
jgi:glycosyltransferase involved in cell wall biosynthesis